MNILAGTKDSDWLVTKTATGTITTQNVLTKGKSYTAEFDVKGKNGTVEFFMGGIAGTGHAITEGHNKFTIIADGPLFMFHYSIGGSGLITGFILSEDVITSGHKPVTPVTPVVPVVPKDPHWLVKYKSCVPGIRFNIVVHSSTKPFIEIPKGVIVTSEEVDPGIWVFHSLDRVGYFKINKDHHENQDIKEIEVVYIKDVFTLENSFIGLAGVNEIHFHGAENFKDITAAFKDTTKLLKVTGLGFGTITNAFQAYMGSGIEEFLTPGSELFNLQNTKEMFKNAINLKKIGDFSEVLPKEMASMFEGTQQLQFITGLNTTAATDLTAGDIFKNSQVRVPNSVEKAKLLAKGGAKFFTQDFNPIFEVEIEPYHRLGLTVSEPKMTETFPSSAIDTIPSLVSKTTAGWSYKSWEPIEHFSFIDVDSQATHENISMVNIKKADLVSLADTFFGVSSYKIATGTINRLVNIDQAWKKTKIKDIDVSMLDFALVTSANSAFDGAIAKSIKLPNMGSCLDVTNLFANNNNLEYFNQLAVHSTAVITGSITSTNLVAPNVYEIQDWKADRTKVLSASIPYPFVAVGTLNISGGVALAIGDNKKRLAPGIQKLVGTEWKKATTRPATYNKITTTFDTFESIVLGATEKLRFLYPVDFVYFDTAKTITLKDSNVTKARILKPGAVLTGVVIEATKLASTFFINQTKLSNVSIHSDSLVNATAMFFGTGPLTHLNIPTENITNGYQMFKNSTIASLENFIFPKMETGQEFAVGSSTSVGAQFPGSTLTNIHSMYFGCQKMKFAGLLKTSNCVDFQYAFNNTPLLLCLKELDTRKAPAANRDNIWGAYSKIINPNAAEKLVLKNGGVYLNKTPCPILEQTINLPQQTGYFQLHSIISKLLVPGTKKVKVINGYTQPAFTFSGVPGVDVTFVNSGSIQATKQSGDAIYLTKPLKIINTGTILGAGGHGGAGGRGLTGGTGAAGAVGSTGGTGKTTPAVSAIKAVKGRKYHKAYKTKYVKQTLRWAGGAGSTNAGSPASGSSSKNGWTFNWSPTGGALYGPCGQGMSSGVQSVCGATATVTAYVSGGKYLLHFSYNPGTFKIYGYHNHKAVSAIKAVKGRAHKSAISGCPGGKGGKGGPGGKGGTAGKEVAGGTGQYWKHAAGHGHAGLTGGAGHPADTHWTGSGGASGYCGHHGDGRHSGGRGGSGHRGSTGHTGTTGGASGSGGTWGHDGAVGAKLWSGHHYGSGAVGKAGRAIHGKANIVHGSSGLSGHHIAGAIT